MARSSIWIGGSVSVGGPDGQLHPIVGRVAFDSAEHSPVDGELYIGPYFHELDELTVISWAAPIASLFYKGSSSTDIAASHVAARRTFTTRDTDLTDFADDFAPGFIGTAFRSTRDKQLRVPTPPAFDAGREAVQRPAQAGGHQSVGADQNSAAGQSLAPPGEHNDLDREAIQGAMTPSIDKESSDSPEGNTSLETAYDTIPNSPETSANPAISQVSAVQELRADSLVREIVSRPRTGKLSALLATLQEDQYDLISWPADRPLIISGQPGTGKTVVALHRAAYLTHPQRDGGPLDRVVLVGPSDEYRDHVQLVSEAAGGRRIPILGVNELLCRIAGIDYTNVEPGIHDRIGVDWGLRAVVKKTARLTKQIYGTANLFDRTLRELLSKSQIHIECVADAELSNWLLAIGRPENVKRHAKYLPLAAAVGAFTRDIASDRVDHLIVDEAQDIPPLVWLILMDLLKPKASVTILGDINQRRSDWTASSWVELARDLEISDEDGNPPLRELKVGYRSTREILKFANQLLPKSERQNHALRDGVPPTVERVPKVDLQKITVDRAIQISHQRGGGLTAIISVDPKPLSDAFRRLEWTRPPTLRDAWTDGQATVFVLHPDRARGLEFDSVIVVEPDAFPLNVGRQGVLYTSLTRATQELCIIYSTKLPQNLRAPR